MTTAQNNTSKILAAKVEIAGGLLFNTLVNTSFIMKKSADFILGLIIPQGQFITDVVGNPVKREIFFMMADDDLS